MSAVLKIFSFIGLTLTLAPSILVFFGIIELEFNKTLMLVGTLLWFSASPLWINKRR